MNILDKAMNLMEMDQVDEALELIHSYAPDATDEESVSIAEFFMQWGFLHEAEAILEKLIPNYPEESELKLLLADCYIENQKDEEAIELLNTISEDDDAYLQVLVALADLYQAQGLFEVAEQKLLQAKHLSPSETVIDLALGELYFSLGDFKRAITYYEKTVKHPVATIPVADRLAESYANVGEYELAIEYYEKAASKHPDALFKYGFSAHKADRNDLAIHIWKELLKEDPYYHSAYLQLAKAYEEEELLEDAYKTAVAGLKVDEYNKELYLEAGKLAHKINLDQNSEQHVREAVSLDADYKEAVLFLIELFKEKEQYEAIVDLIKNVKETGGDDPIYDWELARAFVEIESYNDALIHYKEAYNSLQHDSDFLKEYGYFLNEEGRTKEAVQLFEAYLQHEPDDHEITEYVSRLKQ